jgi:hypothetical protein
VSEHADRFDPREYIPNLPRRPGVYRMYSEGGELLYVGKARSLRDRVGNYFLASNVDPKVQALVGHIAPCGQNDCFGNVDQIGPLERLLRDFAHAIEPRFERRDVLNGADRRGTLVQWHIDARLCRA